MIDDRTRSPTGSTLMLICLNELHTDADADLERSLSVALSFDADFSSADFEAFPLEFVDAIKDAECDADD